MSDTTQHTFAARPTTYKGIKMRSRLEATHAARFDFEGLEWQYEPTCFADESGQYLPDFSVVLDGYVAYYEIKGAAPADIEAVKRRMEIIWKSEPDAWLIIAVDETNTGYVASGSDRTWGHGIWDLQRARTA